MLPRHSEIQNSYMSIGYARAHGKQPPLALLSLQELFDLARKQFGTLAGLRRTVPDAVVELWQHRTGRTNVLLLWKLDRKANQEISPDKSQFVFQVRSIGLERLRFY